MTGQKHVGNIARLYTGILPETTLLRNPLTGDPREGGMCIVIQKKFGIEQELLVRVDGRESVSRKVFEDIGSSNTPLPRPKPRRALLSPGDNK